MSNEIYDNSFKYQCINFDIYPIIIPHKKRIIAIGDIHGDIDWAINSLFLGSLIEEVNIKKIISKKTKIKEYTQKIRIIGAGSVELEKYELIKTSYSDINSTVLNQYDIVYRYYKINGEYYIKIVKNNNARFFKWIGNDTYVVQVGDQIDRCRPVGLTGSTSDHQCSDKYMTIGDEDSDIEIMLLFDSLDKIAKKKGGAVKSLLGNHELLNVVGDMRYVSYLGAEGIGGINKRYELFKSIIAQKMACTRTTILIIGNFIFVHGGIARDLAFKYNLSDINSIIRKFLLDLSTMNNEIYNLIMNNKLSPLWYRELSFIPPNDNDSSKCNSLVYPILNKYTKEINDPTITLQEMVIGHTPNFTIFNTGITTTCNDSVIRVDVGASRAFGENEMMNAKSHQIEMMNARSPQIVEIITDLTTKVSKIKIIH